ncbi:4'-phosphopantetheinyl transferase superfamily protein [Salinimicrobium catena]|uniref:4'-phosphopantetheinyl transferase family protein n=1 Tax=Salinimicrobium catena TaxID=390640 RepID=UPI002FE4D7A4
MIGNDVVDLKAAAAESDWSRKGFLEKVFSEEERELICAAADQHQMVWLLWSMKEAAYKARQRHFNLPRRLNWELLHCSLEEISTGNASGVVKVGAEKYFTASGITSENIHTTARPNSKIPLENFIFETSSAAAKKELLQQTADFHFLPVADLHFKKDLHGMPYISYKNAEFFNRFSFSDHGRYSAFSLSLRIS